MHRAKTTLSIIAAIACVAILAMIFLFSQRDSGTAGQRDSGTAGQRDSGTAGQRDSGTAGASLSEASFQATSSAPARTPEHLVSEESAFAPDTGGEVGNTRGGVDNNAPAFSASSQPAGSGMRAGLPVATIQASSGRISGSPNDLGLFPRVLTEIGETVEISATFPDAEPGDLIFVQAEDGGALDGGPPVARLYLDENRSLHFAFRGTAEGGLSRVTLRKDLDEKHLEFWAGPEPTGPMTP